MKNISFSTVGVICLLLVSINLFSACKEKDNPSSQTETIQVTADTSVVTKLGIVARPIIDSTARLIAEAASTGKTTSSSSATISGIALFDVQIQVGSITISVKVRATDGAVITIIDPEDGEHRP